MDPEELSYQRNMLMFTNYGAPGGLQSGNGKTVSVVDLTTNEIIETIETDQGPAALVLSHNQQLLYVVCYVDGEPGTGTLNVIQTSNNQIINKTPGFSGPFGIDVTPDDKFAYVTNFGSNNFAPYGTSVSCVNLCPLHIGIIKNIEVGIQPSGVMVSNDGRLVYVSCYNALYAKANFQQLTYGEGTVNVIQTKDNEVIGTAISVGQTPATITLSRDGNRLYICKYVQATVLSICLKN